MTDWYHFSPCPSIYTFRPFSHFGTKAAASEIAEKKEMDVRIKNASPTLYRVSISVESGNWIELKDSASPTPASFTKDLNRYFESCGESPLIRDQMAMARLSSGDLSLDLQRLMELDFSDQFKHEYKNRQISDHQKLKEFCRVEAFRLLAEKLISRGYSGVSYINEHEDVGSRSLCVFDTFLINILGREVYAG